jgi:AraC-like DNA-binding protein
MKNPQDAVRETSVRRRVRVASDPDEAAENARPREQRLLPLDREPYRIAIESLAVGPFLLRSEQPSGALAVSATPASGTKAVFGCHGGVGSFHYAGRERDKRDLVVSHGGDSWQGLIPGGAKVISITFEVEALRSACLARGLAEIESVLHGAWVLPAQSNPFMARILRILDATARVSPSDDESCRASIEEDVLDLLLSVLPEVASVRSRVSATARRKALRRAIDFTAENLGSPPRVSDLCRAAETSERTLDYAFREAYGLSPGQFLRRIRLASARQALMRGTTQDTSVLAVATQLGFYDAGHFASDYRQTFGELPSITLRQASPASAGRRPTRPDLADTPSQRHRSTGSPSALRSRP